MDDHFIKWNASVAQPCEFRKALATADNNISLAEMLRLLTHSSEIVFVQQEGIFPQRVFLAQTNTLRLGSSIKNCP